MTINYCPTCGAELTIIEYPVKGVMTQFWYCSDCEYERPVVDPLAKTEEAAQEPVEQ